MTVGTRASQSSRGSFQAHMRASTPRAERPESRSSSSASASGSGRQVAMRRCIRRAYHGARMKRLAYALLAMIWIAGIWIWMRPEPQERATPALQPCASAEQATLSEANAKPGAPSPHAPLAPAARHRQRVASDAEAVPLARLRVKSSVSLPLLYVEVSIAGEDWIEVDLPEEGLEVEPSAYPLRVRAAGHLEADAPRG